MNYEQLEDELVAQLQPLTVPVGPGEDEKGWSVQFMPETKEGVEDEARAIFQSCVIARYSGSEYEKLESQRMVMGNTSVVQQQEFVMIDILLESTKLRGPRGIYAMIRAVKLLLVGFEPTNCKKMVLVEGGLNNFNGKGIWQRYLKFYCETTVVDAITIEDVLGVLKRIRLTNETTLDELTVEAPTAPAIETVEVGTNNIKIKWPVVEGAQGYRVDVSTTDDFVGLVKDNVDVAGSVEYDATGLSANTNYFIRARAYNLNTVSVNSNVLTEKTNV